MIDPQFNLDLQVLANKYQVHVKGIATPVNPEEDAFDIVATATTPVTPAPTDAPTDPTPAVAEPSTNS